MEKLKEMGLIPLNKDESKEYDGDIACNNTIKANPWIVCCINIPPLSSNITMHSNAII